MKFNKWTLGLAALGVVSLASAARADEAKLSQVQTALSNTTLSGYVDVAAIWRPGTDQGPATGFPGGYGANSGTANIPASSFSKNDGFYLNVVDLALDKPMDEGPWASGYHIELQVGPDTITTPRQAYITLRTPLGNGIDWKVGVFDTIIGYESNSDPLNPNYTRSYGYTIEPTTHTGVTATYKVSDAFSFTAGVADGSNAGPAPAPVNGIATYESQKAYMGNIALTAPDSFGALKGATLTLGIIDGVDSSLTASGTGTKVNYFAGLSLPTPSSAVKLGGAFDYLRFDNKGGANANNDSVWVAGAYVTISASDKLSFNFRGEFVDATQIGSAGLPLSPNPLGAAYAGHHAEELTATVQYQVWANVLSRVEFRWDHVEANAFGYSQGGTTGIPNRDNDFMLALNLIYQF